MKTQAIEKLNVFGKAIEDDLVCPKTACKLLDAAMRLVAPSDVVEAEPVEPTPEPEVAPVEPVVEPEPAAQIEPGQEVEQQTSPEDVAVIDPDASDLETAIRALDPTNDDHWTKAGLPSIKEVESLLGQDVSRDDISEAIEGYDRETAQG